ncbi:EexN family lipoprotein [Buttiauxella ferragutiae]|uniref:EexN family lipoprotein n=1 Tax=Buttiauxella ferragutiae TaxID=82989 RepID=UPI001F534E93|nr:EexN family lipoprotein [Buttiauxella ferragutiae]UNK63136.1 EexN family lipoprotein [Buttiauxella ferragutiae]
MKKTLVTLIFIPLFLLTGCEDKYSKEWFIKNHDEMIAKYTECLLDHSWSEQICQNAKNAMKQERGQPDVEKGRKAAFDALDKQIARQKVPDLNHF